MPFKARMFSGIAVTSGNLPQQLPVRFLWTVSGRRTPVDLDRPGGGQLHVILFECKLAKLDAFKLTNCIGTVASQMGARR